MGERKTETLNPSILWRVRFGATKLRSLVLTAGLRQAVLSVLSNVLSFERMHRFNKELADVPDTPVRTKEPMRVRMMTPDFTVEQWEDLPSLVSLRGEYGIVQFRQRLARGYVLFCAYVDGELAGFIWFLPPPVMGVDAGVRLATDEAYMIDGWTFEQHRGKGVLPFLQVAVFDYARTYCPVVRRVVTHGAVSNRASVAGQLKAGFTIVATDLSVSLLGYNAKLRLRTHHQRGS